MEKIKFGEKTFDLVPNGIDDFDAEKLTLRFESGAESLENVETLLSDAVNTKRIEILDEDGSLQRPLTGYVYLKSISKIKDYLIEIQTIPAAEEGGEPTYKEVKADIVEAVLTKADLRKEVEELSGLVNTMLGVE